MSQTRATVYAVAQRAGVSIATVSRVQRGQGPVSPETRARVLAAIDELRYRPSPSGRALAEQRHDAMGIVFPDLAGPYYAEVILGVEAAMVAAGKSLLILATHGRERSADLVYDMVARVDGLILMDRTISDDDVRALELEGTPVVLLARRDVDATPAVRAESLAPAEELTAHLIGHGHTRLAFLGDPDTPDAEERWRGFLAAHAALRIPAPDGPVPAAFSEAAGHDAALNALDDGATALVCASDEIALGAYGAAAERGAAVPDDIAITGWDDIQLARFVSPGLTTVRQPMRRLGATAAELLFERVAGGTPAGRVLRSHVVLRASCGCPPQGETSHREVAR